MYIWFFSRYKPRRSCKPKKPHGKPGLLSILLIIIGGLLVMIYTPPWVWCFLLGIGLILAGIFILMK